MICGLVLAAGAGTRFGERSKLLAELDGRPLLEHAVAAQCAVADLERVAVVLGAFAEEILARVDFMRAEPVVCERWEEGQALSLRCGIEHLTAQGERQPSDRHAGRPAAGHAGADRAIPRRAARNAGRVSAACRGTRSYWGRSRCGPSPALRGDHGARKLLQGGATIECGDSSAVRDVDTPEDLEAIRHEARAVL